MRFSRSGRVPGVLLFLATGCGDPTPAADPALAHLLDGAPGFVRVPRPSVEGASLRSSSFRTLAAPDIKNPGTSGDFYLAISRKELGQSFFLSAYLKQYFPGGVGSGAAVSMGTQIITLSAGSGRVFLIRKDNISRISDTFGPDGVILNAFPQVSYPPFERLPGASGYVLFDPAAGISSVPLVFGDAWGDTEFRASASYLQNLRAIDDGLTWEQVMSGSTKAPLYTDDELEPNAFRVSAVLGMGLRRYQEGMGFKEVVPAAKMWPSYFFEHGPRLIKNTGQRDYVAALWNIADTKKTIEWIVSPSVPTKYQSTVIEAIESWNDAFGVGRKVITARMARPDESFADDDKNYFIYDGDPSLGYAYANWRYNPNNGEIRGASVYINRGWFDTADRIEMTPPHPTMIWPDRAAEMTDEELAERAKERRRASAHLHLPGVTNGPICELWEEDIPRGLKPGAGEADAKIPAAEQAKGYIRHVTTHEIGHTLGLRHNFKGSTGAKSADEPGTTVMDYQSTAERILLSKPGTYDIAAIKLLYGLSATEPADPFCTDDGTRSDPECQTFDSGKDPLNDYFKVSYEGFLNDFLDGKSASSPNNSLNQVLMFVRAGKDAAQRKRGWDLAMGPLSVKTALPAMAPMGYADRKDFVARRALGRLWLDAANQRGNITADPPADPMLVPLYYQELKGNILNEDKIRSYETRRLVVKVLRKLQTMAARNLLMEAGAKLTAELPGLGPDEAIQHQDLIVRIDAALAPYFDN